MNPYRRLGILCRLSHVLYGFLTAYASTVNPLLAILMLLSFSVYEFSETIHDILTYKRFKMVDFPDDEFAELGAGMALYALLSMLHFV